MWLTRDALRSTCRGLAATLLVHGTAAAATVTTLYSFSGHGDGAEPRSPLIADRQGNLYGTTEFGGTRNFGVVFRLSPPAQQGGAWTETILHNFATRRDGVGPNPPLVMDMAGNLVGTTFDGGDCFYYCGVAFRLSPPTADSAPWTYSVLYRFPSPGIGTGGAPTGALLSDGAGGYYGTTLFGGAEPCTNVAGPCGTAFHIQPRDMQQKAWSETLLYSFKGVPDAEYPVGALVAGAEGDLYGATYQGGRGRCGDGEGSILGCGTIFQLHQHGGNWSERLLYQFKASEMNSPNGPLTVGADGDLYGTASYDIFRVIPSSEPNHPWTKQVIYTFEDGDGGTIPWEGLIFDASGNIYGASDSSGLNGFSTVFKLSPRPSGALPWRQTILAQFGHGLSSEQPSGGLLLGRDGILYGALTSRAGNNKHHRGSIFAITP